MAILFTPANVDRVVNEMENFFTDGTFLSSVEKFNNFNIKLQTLYNKLNTPNISMAEFERLGAEAYLYIQKIRSTLFGDELTYRYYIVEPSGKYEVFNVTDVDLLRMLYKGSDGDIRLRKTKQAAETMKKNFEYQKVLDQHMNNLMNGMTTSWKDAQTKSGKSKHLPYRVRYFILVEYNDGERLGTIVDGSPRFNSFNGGHIAEAFDQSVAELTQNAEPQVIFSELQDLFYGKYLGGDNVQGFKGGDNSLTNTSIKANKASLMQVNTIKKSLAEIIELFNPGDISKINVHDKVEEMFVDKSAKNQTAKVLTDFANKQVNELVKMISSQLQ